MPSRCCSSPSHPSSNMCMKLTSKTATPVLKSMLDCPSAFKITHLHFSNWYLHFERYVELSEKVKKGGGESSIARHTQKNRKLLVRDRLRLLLDDEDFFELSSFAGLGLPYGDIPSAGCLTGQKPLSPVQVFY